MPHTMAGTGTAAARAEGADAPQAAGPAVCHITTVHPVFDSRIFTRECLALQQAGYQVHLVACHDRDEVVEGVRIHALPRAPGRLKRNFVLPWLAYRKVLAIRPRPMICHFHDPALLAVGYALRLRGFTVVYDVHEHVVSSIAYKPYLPLVVRWPLAWAYWLGEQFLTSGMAIVTTVASNARRYRPPCRIVHNYARLRDTQVSVHRDKEQPPRLVYLGRVCEATGATAMLHVAAELQRRNVEFEMRIVGPVTEPGLEDRMREVIRAGALEGRVTMTGQLPAAEAMRELALSDIGLCLFPPTPNNRNNLPRKMMEYLSFGLAVVASDFEGWRRYLVDTGGGLQVPFGDVGVMADAVQALMADPERMREMGRRARESVEQRLCWEKEQQKLLDFYAWLLRRRKHGRRGGRCYGCGSGTPGRSQRGVEVSALW